MSVGDLFVSTSKWTKIHMDFFRITAHSVSSNEFLKRLFSGGPAGLATQVFKESKELGDLLNTPQAYTRRDAHKILKDIGEEEYDQVFFALRALNYRNFDEAEDLQASRTRTSQPRAKKLQVDYKEKDSQGSEESFGRFEESQLELPAAADSTEGGTPVNFGSTLHSHLKRDRSLTPSSSEAGSDYARTAREERMKETQREDFSVHAINAFLHLIIKKYCEAHDGADDVINVDLHATGIPLSIEYYGQKDMISVNDSALVPYVTSTGADRYRPLRPLDPLLVIECKRTSPNPDQLPFPQVAGEFIATVQQRVRLLGGGDPASLTEQARTVMGLIVQGDEVTMVSCKFSPQYLHGLAAGKVDGDMTMVHTAVNELTAKDGRRNLAVFVSNVLRNAEHHDSWVVQWGMQRVAEVTAKQ